MVNYSTAVLDATFGALSDATRRAILARLCKGEATVKSLAEPFEMSLPAVSKHLRVLESAGLLRREIDGRIHRCRLNAEPMRSAAAWIERYRTFWGTQFDALAKFLESNEKEEEDTWQRRSKVNPKQVQQNRAKAAPGSRSKSAGRSPRRAKRSSPPGRSGNS